MRTERITLKAWGLSEPRGPAGKLLCDTCPGRSLGVCRPLDDQRLGQLLAMGGQRRWAKRESLYRTDDPVQMLYKITKGIVTESRVLNDGRRQIVGIRTVGDLCGYPDHQGRHLFSAEAHTEVEACAFERTRFHAFVGRHIEVACALAEDTAERLKRATENMTVIGQLKSTERVAHFLIEIFALYARHPIGPQPQVLHFTRQEIADYLGLTLETVSRSFSKLRDLHLIALVGGNSVAILNQQKLASVAKVS